MGVLKEDELELVETVGKTTIDEVSEFWGKIPSFC